MVEWICKRHSKMYRILGKIFFLKTQEKIHSKAAIQGKRSIQRDNLMSYVAWQGQMWLKWFIRKFWHPGVCLQLVIVLGIRRPEAKWKKYLQIHVIWVCLCKNVCLLELEKSLLNYNVILIWCIEYTHLQIVY